MKLAVASVAQKPFTLSLELAALEFTLELCLSFEPADLELLSLELTLSLELAELVTLELTRCHI